MFIMECKGIFVFVTGTLIEKILSTTFVHFNVQNKIKILAMVAMLWHVWPVLRIKGLYDTVIQILTVYMIIVDIILNWREED